MSYLGTNRGRARLSLEPVSGLLVPKDLALLCHFDGANNSQLIFDSTKKHQINVLGNAKISTAQAKFGQSLLLDGTGDYLTVSDSDDWSLLSNFTLSFFARFTAVGDMSFANYSGGVAGWSDGGGNLSWNFSYEGGVFYFQYKLAGNNLTTIQYSDTPATGEWLHFAVVISSNTINMYKNGVSKANGTLANYVRNTGGIQRLRLFTGPNEAVASINGHIDELIISHRALWTANFTPPTAPYLPK
jgi:hypothetical protein